MKKFGRNYKDIVRDEVATLIKPNMTIFSLPYLNFTVERKAKIAYCCEKDTEIWAEQTKIAPKNCVLHNKYASSVVGEVPFDLIFLDLCGSISKELFSCIENANLKNQNSKLIISLLKCREHAKYRDAIHRHGGRLPFLKEKLEKSGLYLYKVIEYCDTSPMMILFASPRQRKTVEFVKFIKNVGQPTIHKRKPEYI